MAAQFVDGEFKRVYVTGGPGSGKTTLARRIAQIQGAPLYELDALLLEAANDVARLVVERRVAQMAAAEVWVSDGVYFGWTKPLLDRADLILCLDTPWHVAMFRIVSRHMKAEMSRDNRFPGWRLLWRFLRWSFRYYHDRNPDRLDALGVPGTRSRRMQELAAYRDKLVTCRSTSEAVRFASRRRC
jgi:adenylate kinase family enzyme